MATELWQSPAGGWRKVAEHRADGVFEAHPTAIDDLFQCRGNRLAAPAQRSGAPAPRPPGQAPRRGGGSQAARPPVNNDSALRPAPANHGGLADDDRRAISRTTANADHGNATKPTLDDARAGRGRRRVIEGAITPTGTRVRGTGCRLRAAVEEAMGPSAEYANMCS
jgi:hypothetical protein